MSETRVVEPLPEGFFNDGAWYVLGSTSLGGSGLDPDGIAGLLGSDDEGAVRGLLRDGVCLPLVFPGDCAMDRAILVVGELTPAEEAEWVARVRSRLEIPCGEFLIQGGGVEECFEEALASFAPSPDSATFHKLRVAPGSYLVEVYAFVSSMTVNFAWEDEDDFDPGAWWRETRAGEPEAAWIPTWRKEGYVPADDFPELTEYLVRLIPAATVDAPPLPPLDGELCWVEDFELRRPERCPAGLRRADVLASS